MSCSVCGTESSSFFISIGDKMICTMCKMLRKTTKKTQYQDPPVFVRYICMTHNCGTYSAQNMYGRHYIEKECVIREERTLGIIKPATFGGKNGDISRRWFLGINEFDRLKNNLDNYIKFIHIKRDLHTNKVNFVEKKYYYKHLRFINTSVKKDKKSFDNKFNYLLRNINRYMSNVFIENKKDLKEIKDRDKDNYYKLVLNSFKQKVDKNE